MGSSPRRPMAYFDKLPKTKESSRVFTNKNHSQILSVTYLHFINTLGAKCN